MSSVECRIEPEANIDSEICGSQLPLLGHPNHPGNPVIVHTAGAIPLHREVAADEIDVDATRAVRLDRDVALDIANVDTAAAILHDAHRTAYTVDLDASGTVLDTDIAAHVPDAERARAVVHDDIPAHALNLELTGAVGDLHFGDVTHVRRAAAVLDPDRDVLGNEDLEIEPGVVPSENVGALRNDGLDAELGAVAARFDAHARQEVSIRRAGRSLHRDGRGAGSCDPQTACPPDDRDRCRALEISAQAMRGRVIAVGRSSRCSKQ